MKYNIICSDPPYQFSDKLQQSNTKRGAAANYVTLSNQDIIDLPVKDIVADDALLALWVPSTHIDCGLKIVKNWGFSQKQTWIWVKTKQEPLADLKKEIKKSIKNGSNIDSVIDTFDVNNILNFFMGRLFRQTHEICLIGTRGKISKYIKDKSQRSVHLFKALKKHSEKPEELQDRLERIFPELDSKLEMFARRQRPGWECVGNQMPLSEDIRDSINRLKNL